MEAQGNTETYTFGPEQIRQIMIAYVNKALAKNWRKVIEECRQHPEFLNTKYPHAEYLKIVNSSNEPKTFYWLHKHCSKTFHSLEQLLCHVKTPCNIKRWPRDQLATVSQNAFRNVNCIAVFALTSLVYAINQQKKQEILAHSHLNEILWLGALKYNALIRSTTSPSISLDDLEGCFSCDDPLLRANISLQRNICDDELEGFLSFHQGKDRLLHALEVSMDSGFEAIINIGNQSAALFNTKENDKEYISVFYSQPIDESGQITKVKSKDSVSCLKKFPKDPHLCDDLYFRFPHDPLKNLCDDLYFNFFLLQDTSGGFQNPCHFRITLVKVEIDDP